MDRQALVIASAGAGVPEALDGITAVEEALSAAAEGYVCVRAFTSPAIRRILKDRGEDVPGLEEALETLAATRRTPWAASCSDRVHMCDHALECPLVAPGCGL